MLSDSCVKSDLGTGGVGVALSMTADEAVATSADSVAKSTSTSGVGLTLFTCAKVAVPEKRKTKNRKKIIMCFRIMILQLYLFEDSFLHFSLPYFLF